MINGMAQSINDQLIELSEAFGAHQNVSHWRVSFLARGDGQFFRRLKAGKGCSTRTAELVLAYFSEVWPEDLTWPAHIPRPMKSEVAA